MASYDLWYIKWSTKNEIENLYSCICMYTCMNTNPMYYLCFTWGSINYNLSCIIFTSLKITKV